jgi:hypothetical protein
LKGTCELLPFEVVQRECVDNIEKNFADIYNMVLDNTDPGIICRVANVCKDEHLIENQKDSKVDIRILNPQDTDLATPFNSEKKQNLLGSKTEVLVAQVRNIFFYQCQSPCQNKIQLSLFVFFI